MGTDWSQFTPVDEPAAVDWSQFAPVADFGNVRNGAASAADGPAMTATQASGEVPMPNEWHGPRPLLQSAQQPDLDAVIRGANPFARVEDNAFTQTLLENPVIRGAQERAYQSAGAAGLLAAMPVAVGVDALRGDSAATDWTGRNWVDAPARAAAEYAADPEADGVTQALHSIGGLGVDLATAAPMRAARAVEPIVEAGLAYMGQRQLATKAMLDAAKETALPASVPAVSGGATTAKNVIDAGGSVGDALLAGGADALGTEGEFMVPVNAPGNLFSRATQGALSNVAASEAHSQAVNPLLPASLQRPTMDGGGMRSTAVVGGLMGAVLGPHASSADRIDRLRRLADRAIAGHPDASQTKPPPHEGVAPEPMDDLDALVAPIKSPAEQAIDAGRAVASAAFDAAGAGRSNDTGAVIPDPTALDLSQQTPLTPPAHAPDAAAGSPAPIAAPEPIRNGTRVLYRGDVPTIQATLDAAGLPGGFRMVENGQPVGVYFPARMQADVDAALAPLREPPTAAPVPDAPQAQPDAAPSPEAQPANPEAPTAHQTTTGNRITDDLVKRLAEDHEGAVTEYGELPDSRGGVVLNTDIARELSPDYRADRTKSADVHEPASAFIKSLYAEKLAQPTPEGMDNTVLFTAGGTGAGKTTGERAAGDAFGKPEIVYDTNMNKLESSGKKIQQALEAGRKVEILYTYRDPVDALVGGALPRAMRMEREQGTGRTVPLDEHAKTHEGAYQTIKALIEKYDGDDRVNFTFVDNSRGKNNEQMVDSLDELPVPEYYHGHDPRHERSDSAGVHPQAERGGPLTDRLLEALDAEHAAGKISDAVYRGFAGRAPQRTGGSREVEQPPRYSKTSETPADAGVSASGAPKTALTLPDLQAATRKAFGSAKVLTRLVNRGTVVPITKAEAIARGLGTRESLDGVKGLHDGKRAYLITDELRPDEVAGVLTHEVGVHHTMEKILGPERFAALLKLMASLRARGDKDVLRAYDSVPGETPAQHVDHEAAAYLAEATPNHTISQKLTNGTKLFLNQLGIPMTWLKAEPAAIRKIAREALLAESRGEAGGVRTYRGADDPLYQRVYHGTPHRGIEQTGFKLDKIGTGEGAQAFGHGMYFAGKREIAEHYRQQLAIDRRRLELLVSSYDDAGMSDTETAKQLRHGAEQARFHERNRDARDYDEAARWLDAGRPEKFGGGQLYHAEIPEDHDLLDWDRPLSEQPEKVKAALRGLGIDADAKYGEKMTGRDVYSVLSMRHTDELDRRTGRIDEHQSASRDLHDAGVPGLRYLDGSSREDWQLSPPSHTAAGDWMVKDASRPDSQGLHFATEADARAELARHQQDNAHNYVIWDEGHLTPEKAQITPYYSRRIFQKGKDAPRTHDYIVPETPEFDGNDSGDLAYTPRSAEANGIEQLPIRLTVGVARDVHRGYGMMHLTDEANRNTAREAPSATNDRAENFARQVALVARDFTEAYQEGRNTILRSPRMKEALVTERKTDPETGEAYYSVVSLRPAERAVWGDPDWRAGRGQAPADRLPLPGAPDRHLADTSQQPSRQSREGVQSEHFDLTAERAGKQASATPSVTVKRRRAFTPTILKSARKTPADSAQDAAPASEAGLTEGERNKGRAERARREWDEKGTDSHYFRRWFGEEGVRDADGKPQVFYHSGEGSFSRVNEGEGRFGGVFILPDKAAAHYGEAQHALYLRGPVADTGDLRRFLHEQDDGGIGAVEKIVGRPVNDQALDSIAQAVFDESADADGFRDAIGTDDDSDAYAEMQRIRGQLAKAAGFKGVSIHDEFDGDAVLVTSKSALKSSTNNTGAFDPENPDIRFSRRTPADAERDAAQRRAAAVSTLGGPTTGGAIGWNFDAGKWEGKAGTLRRARAALDDKMIAWRDAQDNIAEALGHAVPDAQNVYRLENLMHGRVKEGIDALEEAQIAPLVKAMHDAGIDTQTLENYLYARHAKERNAQIAAINPDMPDGGSGMTNAEADAILAQPKPPGLLGAVKKVDVITKATRQRLLDHGLITPAQFDAMAAQYQHYVPLRGKQTGENEFPNQSSGAGRGIDGRPSPIKQALGRGEGNRAENILGEIIGDAQRSIIAAEKARVGRSVMRLVLANPNPKLWTVEPVQTERKLDANGEVYEAVVHDWSDPSVIAVRHRGELYKVQVNHAPLSQALNLVGVDHIGSATRAAGALNRYFSAVLTRYNPAFVPVNAVRDAIFGLTSLAVEHGESTAIKAALYYPTAIKAAWREARRPEPTTEADRYARDFAEDGGKTGYVSMPSVEELQRRIGRGRFGSYSPEGIARVSKTLGDMVGAMNDSVENALRLSTYVTLREKGMSREAAAEYAKNVTVNFNRKGSDGSKLNAWFLFYNASMQGAKRTAVLAKHPKTWAYLGTLAAAQVAATMYAMGQEDDDGTPIWDKVPDYVKQRNLVFTWRNGAGAQHILTLPMPYGFNLLPYLAGRVTEAHMRHEGRPQDRAMAMTADAISAAVQSFSPLPLDDGAMGLLPTALRIPVSIQTNRNDFGRQIRKENPFGKFDVPRASIGKPDTLELFKIAAKGLNRIGGGDDVMPPPLSAFDMAPEDLEYILDKLGGGAGKFVIDVATLGQIAAGDAPVAARDIPIIKRFLTNIDEPAAQQSMFYDRREAIEREADRVRTTFEAQGREAALTLLKATPSLSGADFKRYKHADPKAGHKKGGIILVDGRPQLVARGDSVYARYKDAAKTTSEIGDSIRSAYTAAPVSLTPNRARDRMIRELAQQRMEAQRAFNAAWNRDVVGGE